MLVLVLVLGAPARRYMSSVAAAAGSSFFLRVVKSELKSVLDDESNGSAVGPSGLVCDTRSSSGSA